MISYCLGRSPRHYLLWPLPFSKKPESRLCLSMLWRPSLLTRQTHSILHQALISFSLCLALHQTPRYKQVTQPSLLSKDETYRHQYTFLFCKHLRNKKSQIIPIYRLPVDDYYGVSCFLKHEITVLFRLVLSSWTQGVSVSENKV